MSTEAFVKYGHHRGLLGTKDAAPAYPGARIELYDIGEIDKVGAAYPDGARQSQPLTWHTKQIAHALSDMDSRPESESAPPPKPKLVLKRPDNQRPKLRRR